MHFRQILMDFKDLKNHYNPKEVQLAIQVDVTSKKLQLLASTMETTYTQSRMLHIHTKEHLECQD